MQVNVQNMRFCYEIMPGHVLKQIIGDMYLLSLPNYKYACMVPSQCKYVCEFCQGGFCCAIIQ